MTKCNKLFILLAFFGLSVTLFFFTTCKKDSENKPAEPEVPPLLEITKGLSYNDVLENLTANGYTPSETTDSDIIFKGENLAGIHPLADFITDYITGSSKEVTFSFDENGLCMLKFLGDAVVTDIDKLPIKSSCAEMSSLNDFIEDSKNFVSENFESMHVYSLHYLHKTDPGTNCTLFGYPDLEARCGGFGNKHILGFADVFRLACEDFNIYPAYWWGGCDNSIYGQVLISLLPVPDNRPYTGTISNPDPLIENMIEEFECLTLNYLNACLIPFDGAKECCDCNH